MSNNSGPELKSLAERICDGEAIDWPPPAGALSPRPQSALQLLDTIARTCRSMPSAVAEESSPACWGNLQLREVLGEGSYGSVHRAFDPLLEREVALKLSHAQGSQARDWLGEARRLSRVRHPNVVAIHGAEIHDGRAGIWFELIDGQDLQQWIVQQGPLGAGELVAVGQSLCAALAAVHAAGLIHGDIKPGNILREKGGRIVLLDFGSARDSGAGALRTGSPAYLAPELLEGGPPGVASDVFALGMTLKFLLVGPVQDADPAPRRLLDLRSELPQALVDCIESACSADPVRRPQSAGMFSACLGAAAKAPKADADSAPARRSMRGVVAACLAVVVLIAAGWYFLSAPPALLRDVTLMTRDARGVAQPVTAPLQVGAPLSLHLVPSREVFVYVLNQDDRGNRHLLYPLNPEQNPIRSLEPVSLPGLVNGQRVDWQVDSASNTERFAVVASMQRLGGLERALANWPRAGQALPVPDQVLRGVGALAPQAGGAIQDIDEVIAPFRNRDDVEVVMLSHRAE